MASGDYLKTSAAMVQPVKSQVDCSDHGIVFFGLTWHQYRESLLSPALWTAFGALVGFAAYRTVRQPGVSPPWMATMFAVLAGFALWRIIDTYNEIEDADPRVDRSARWQLALTGIIVLSVTLSIELGDGAAPPRGARHILTVSEAAGVAFLMAGFKGRIRSATRNS